MVGQSQTLTRRGATKSSASAEESSGVGLLSHEKCSAKYVQLIKCSQ